MATAAGRKVTLKSSDGQVFEIEETAAMESHMVKLMIEDDCADTQIPLPNVTGTVLAKVVEYCTKHAEKEEDKEQLRVWDAEFINVDYAALYDLIVAANYLDMKNLLDLGIQKAADMIRGKSPEEIRQIFHIENDFTPEEEEQIRNDYAWAFNSQPPKRNDETPRD